MHQEKVRPVLDHETGDLLKYHVLLYHPKFKVACNLSAANEFSRLAQGVRGSIKRTNTIYFISKNEVPADRFKDVTYI